MLPSSSLESADATQGHSASQPLVDVLNAGGCHAKPPADIEQPVNDMSGAGLVESCPRDGSAQQIDGPLVQPEPLRLSDASFPERHEVRRKDDILQTGWIEFVR